jgi:predicted O-linked N-acetylglucosamine transferase (SPINDLY family)
LPASYHDGLALHRQGQFHQALASYDQALLANPNAASILNGRGLTLIALGRVEDALADFQRAMALDPADIEAYLNAGTALNDSGRFPGALQLAARAISLSPTSGAAWFVQAVALDRLGRIADAIEAYGKAIAVDDSVERAAGRRLFLKMRLCRWDGLADDLAHVLKKADEGHLVAAPYHLLTLPASPAQQRANAELFVRKKFAGVTPLPLPRRPRGSKIRIGYFSPDFRMHAVSHLTAGLFEAHDRSRFEVIAFSFGASPPDAMTERLQKAFDRFIDINPHADADAVGLIRDLGIDIAVDLAGHTLDNRLGLLACRVAPIQVAYLGYPGTTGMDAIDYLIADDILIPLDHRPHYTEKIASLPTYQVNDWKRPFPDHAVSRRDVGLPENAFVFCGFNSTYKITPREFDIWMRLLCKVNGSVLWLRDGPPEVVANLRKEAEQRGVAQERLVFAPHVDMTAHLARHQAADLFLDTLTYNAHTTASDALWMGLPVVTMCGATFPGRVAASVLAAAGLPELATRTEADYEALALDLALHPHKLARAKQHLRDYRTTCALFDTARFARNIEAAYERMLAIHDAGGPPAHFSVAE